MKYGLKLFTCDKDPVNLSLLNVIQFDSHKLDHHCSNKSKYQTAS